MQKLTNIALLAPASSQAATEERIDGVLPIMSEIHRSNEATLMENFKYAAGRDSEDTERLRMVLDAGGKRDELLIGVIRDFSQVMTRPAMDAVDPVGRSVNRLTVSGSQATEVVDIDPELADRIRATAKADVGPLREFRGVVRGLIDYNDTMRFALDGDDSKMVPCDLVDPAGMGDGSLYYEAFGNKRMIVVNGKPHTRDGEIRRLTVIDARWE